MPRQKRSEKTTVSRALATEGRQINFLDFTADLDSGELFRKGEKVAIQERPFQILSLLLQRPNEIVTRREICEAVWKRSPVLADASLNTAIRKLRAALGDDARTPSIIKTVGNRGYEFAVQTQTAAPGEEQVSVVVTPFQNLSGPEHARFAEWMTEQMIVQLADPRSQIKVVAPLERRASSDVVAARADFLLQGGIIHANGQVRVNVQLSRASDGERVWARSFQRKIEDVFRAQDEITLQIACEILQMLPRSDAERVISADVYGKTRKGQHFAQKWNEPAFERAVVFFEQAIREDPNFAHAHAALARTHASMLQYGVRTPMYNRDRILAEAGKALELCPNLPQAIVAIGCAQMFHDADWKSAEQSFQHALNVDASSAYAYETYTRLLLTLGRHEEAVHAANRARELDPLSPYAHTVTGAVYYFGRRYEEAMQPLKHCIEMEPCFSMARAMLARCYESLGRSDEAIQQYRAALECAPESSVMMANLSHGLSVAGQKEEARELLAKLLQIRERTYVPAYWIAMCYVGLGDIDQALEWMETSVRECCGWRILAGVDPKLDVIRDRAEFKAILERIGL